MKVGDLVWVEMKRGRKMGQIIRFGMDGIFIQAFDHPRLIIAKEQDVTRVVL